MSTSEQLYKTGKILTMVMLGLTVVGFIIGLIAYLVRKKQKEEEEKKNKSLGYSSDNLIKDNNVRRDIEITRDLGKINVAQYKTILNTQQYLDSLSSLNNGLGNGVF